MNYKAIYILKEAPAGSETRCQQAFLLLMIISKRLENANLTVLQQKRVLRSFAKIL